jgi:membrane-anchored glycerophosphoryl diester phosphodiesterase (GDPDase)
MNYGDLIRDAFTITLRNRYLWFFGFFVGGTGSNFGGNFSSGGNFNPGNFNPDNWQRAGAGLSGLTAQVGQGVLGNAVLIFGIVVVVLLIVLLFIIMAIISQGALADSVAAIDSGEGRRFGSTFTSGIGNFWRVLGYDVVFFLIALGLLVVIGIPVALLIGGTFVATQSTGTRILVAVVVGLLAILALIVIFVPLSIVGQYALREIVVRRERVVGSVGSGYGLFRRNLGRSLLLWLIQLGLSIGLGIAFILLLLIVGLVLALPAIALAIADSSWATIVAVGAPAALIWFILFLVVTGAIGTFIHAYWTLAYLRLTAPPTPLPDPTPTPG